MTQDFWNNKWSDFKPVEFDLDALREKALPIVKTFINLLGNVNGKKILDMGCGHGILSVCLAMMGANVTAIDNSPVAIKNTLALGKVNHVESLLEVHQLDALDVNKLGKSFDLVVGRFILHHVEPFHEFSELLSHVIAKGGKGIFIENNSLNPIIMFFRTYVAGRFGIPKYGDSREHPLEQREIEILKQRFNIVYVHYPSFTFFSLMQPYVFKRNIKFGNIFRKMDEWVYNHWPVFHKYSYLQIIEIHNL